MAQKTLDEDLHVIQNSGLELSLLEGNLAIIQELDDEPNDKGGLTAAELKARFDQAGLTIQKYINETLIPEVLGSDLTEANREAKETQRQANETQRQAQEASRQTAETQRQTAQEAFFNGVKAAAYTLPPDAQATASAVRAGDSFRVNFGIPKGDKGDKGDPGDSNLPTPVSSTDPQILTMDANSGTAEWKRIWFPVGSTTSPVFVLRGTGHSEVPDQFYECFLPPYGMTVNGGKPGQVYTRLSQESADWADLPKSAYQLAVDGGYTGTEDDFKAILGSGPWLAGRNGLFDYTPGIEVVSLPNPVEDNSIVSELHVKDKMELFNIPISGVGNPEFDYDAANKYYVDTAIRAAVAGAMEASY